MNLFGFFFTRSHLFVVSLPLRVLSKFVKKNSPVYYQILQINMHAIIYYAMLCYAVPCHAMLAVLCCAMLHYAPWGGGGGGGTLIYKP